MDLKEILDFFRFNGKKLCLFFVLGLFFGGIVYGILPSKFISSGTLFIGKTIADSGDFYAYSGYYDQQTALSFTRTVKGFLEDKNLYAEVLTDLKEDVTEKNLRNFRRKVRVKDAGAQILSLEIRANSLEEAETTWNTLVEKTIDTVETANVKSNEKLFVQKVNSAVWSREITRNPLVFSIVGGLLFTGFGTFFLSVKVYLGKNLEEKL